MWGWLPALLWVVLGSIFIGAVHDFGALVVSLRNRGQTVGDIAGRLITPRMRFLFLGILLFGLWIVLAIFGLVIASVFKMFPEAILPVFLQVPIAVVIGLWLHRRRVGLLVPSAIALALMYVTVWFGAGCPGTAWEGGAIGQWVQTVNTRMSEWPLWFWTAVLLAYCYVASVLPVWVLLQPRDYINSLQLISSLGLVVVSIAVAALMGVGGRPVEIVAPTFQLAPLNAPPIWPVLFTTIACGAISGFHCLVSSGTSSKQLRCETDAQFVGYGSMLTESFLAVLVVLAVAAGIGLGWPDHRQYAGLTGSQLWQGIYHDWNAAKGLQPKIGAFVVGSANFLQAVGLDYRVALAIIGVLVASFAGTTLDTATRLQRYVVQELSRALAESVPSAGPFVRPLRNAYGATFFAVLTAFALAICPPPGAGWTAATLGKGGLILWPLFGATNQLLAGLAFLVICFWLWRRSQPVWFIVLPALFMLVIPAWAMLVQIRSLWSQGSYMPTLIGVAAIVLEAWMVVEAFRTWPRVKGVLEEALPPLVPTEVAIPSGGGSNC